MTLIQLKHFIAAAEHLNFVHAADELYIHPTSIGRSVATIESELGTLLFIRDGKSLTLTDTGNFLLREARQWLLGFDEMLNKARNVRIGTSGQVIIRGQPNYLKILQNGYHTFLGLYPEANINMSDVKNEELGQLVQDIMSCKVDVGLVFFPVIPRNAEGLGTMRVFSEKMDIVLSNKHPFANRPYLEIEDLQGQIGLVGKYMAPDAFDTINAELKRMSLPTIKLPAHKHLPSTEVDLYMQISAGYGIALLPRSAALKSNWDCSVIPLRGLNLQRDLYLVWNINNPNPTLKLFLDIVHGTLF